MDQKDIVFFRIKTNTPTDQPINVAYPYVSQLFPTQPAEVEENDLLSEHCNPNLLALGIVLLELYFNKPIEGRRAHDDMTDGVPNRNTDLTAAKRWLMETYRSQLSATYGTAVAHCIDCCFDPAPKSTDLHDESFREAIYQKILLPLERELQVFQGLGF
jgi:hypothetical protein